jgi:hypothetical protein
MGGFSFGQESRSHNNLCILLAKSVYRKEGKVRKENLCVAAAKLCG